MGHVLTPALPGKSSELRALGRSPRPLRARSRMWSVSEKSMDSAIQLKMGLICGGAKSSIASQGAPRGFCGDCACFGATYKEGGKLHTEQGEVIQTDAAKHWAARGNDRTQAQGCLQHLQTRPHLLMHKSARIKHGKLQGRALSNKRMTYTLLSAGNLVTCTSMHNVGWPQGRSHRNVKGGCWAMWGPIWRCATFQETNIQKA